MSRSGWEGLVAKRNDGKDKQAERAKAPAKKKTAKPASPPELADEELGYVNGGATRTTGRTAGRTGV